MWPASSWPYPALGTQNIGRERRFLTNIVVPPIIFEHCAIEAPLPDYTGSSYTDPYSYTIVTNTGMRHAQATIKLRTGGAPGSTAKNIFVLSTSATNMPLLKEPPPSWTAIERSPDSHCAAEHRDRSNWQPGGRQQPLRGAQDNRKWT